MFYLKDAVHVRAPLERCFLLSTSLALVRRELRMRPVASKSTRTEGLVQLNDRIYWRGWRFGLPQYHVSLISAYEPNRFFQDIMVEGRFRRFQHDHEFAEMDGHTLLKDTIRFSMPYGLAGKFVAKRILVPHIQGLLARRFALLKRIAESDEWRNYLPPA